MLIFLLDSENIFSAVLLIRTFVVVTTGIIQELRHDDKFSVSIWFQKIFKGYLIS